MFNDLKTILIQFIGYIKLAIHTIHTIHTLHCLIIIK